MSTLTDRGVRVHLGPDGLDLATGPLAPRVVGRTASRASVALVSTGASLLGGDRLSVDLAVAPGLTLLVRDTSATVAYHGRGRSAAIRTRIEVGADATLVWDAEPLVLADGAEVTRDLVVSVATGGRVLLRDTLVLGRTGEAGGLLRCRTLASYDGRPALVETLALDEGRGAPGLLGSHRVVDSALSLGDRPGTGPAGGATVLDLAEPGRLVRWLGAAAHASPVGSIWRGWHAEAAHAGD